MRRIAHLVFVFISIICAVQLIAQSQGQKPPVSAPADSASEGIAPEVADAEAAIVKSDWKTAQPNSTRTSPRTPPTPAPSSTPVTSPTHQDHLDAAAGFYRRAIEANPNSFEAHLALGLLLARQGKKDEAHTELLAATTLDPGEAGPALKARAWRALARLDNPGPDSQEMPPKPPTSCSKPSSSLPKPPADTLLAADLAEAAGQHDAAEAAYRRVLADDPKSIAANSGLAHVLIESKQYPEAEKLIRIALEQAPDDPALNAQLATVLAAQDNADALPLLQKLHAAHPADPGNHPHAR